MPLTPKPKHVFDETYQLEEELGRGASSVCYKATTKNGTTVAVKTIPISRSINRKATQNTKDQVIAEAQFLNCVDHQNIIKFRDLFEDEQTLYIVTEYSEEKDLEQILRRKSQSQDHFKDEDLWLILRQLLQGLAFLHKRGVIHSDIKPSNLFVNEQLKLKIGDFGSALHKQDAPVTGTPLFLSPEAIRGEAVSNKSDIWAVGITMYYLITFNHPFKGSNVVKLGSTILNSQPDYPEHVSQDLVDALIWMLHKNEEKRPSALDLLKKYFTLDQKTLDDYDFDGKFVRNQEPILLTAVVQTPPKLKVSQVKKSKKSTITSLDEQSLDGEGETIILHIDPKDFTRHSRESSCRFSSYRSKGSFQARQSELLNFADSLEQAAQPAQKNSSFFSQCKKDVTSIWQNKQNSKQIVKGSKVSTKPQITSQKRQYMLKKQIKTAQVRDKSQEPRIFSNKPELVSIEGMRQSCFFW